MHNELYFKPLIKNGTIQTILGGGIGKAKIPNYTRESIELDNGDRLLIDISQSNNWCSDDYTVVMIHGLCGCSESEYLLRLTSLLLGINLKVVRVSLHGQGDRNKMHSKSIYHGSSFEDLKKVFEYLTYRNPNSPMIGIGFSLSGGIILKMLSQIQVRDKLLLDYVISICPVTDFKESSKQIHQGINKIFERYFINLCIKMARRRFVEYNDLEPLPKFRKNMSLYEFDDIYTSKEAGYNNADEYYKASSSIDSIHQIRIKTDILVALDDPIIDNEKLLKLDLNKNIRINYTKYGGHMGYLQWPLGKRWLDTQILSWVKSHIIGSKLQNINKFKKI